MCIKASEESLTCATNTTFWSQKTVDILNYPKDKGPNKKKNNAFLHLSYKRVLVSSTDRLVAFRARVSLFFEKWF